MIIYSGFVSPIRVLAPALIPLMFCFVYKGENDSYSRFEALEMMAENVSEIGLRHPVVLKYVDIKWRKRGFKYTLALILMTLVFHVCLMIYTTLVIGVVEKRKERTGRYLLGWKLKIFLSIFNIYIPTFNLPIPVYQSQSQLIHQT